MGVSILVFVELAPGEENDSHHEITNLVSILVFVELAPGVLPPYHAGSDTPGFNPCFCGTRPRR